MVGLFRICVMHSKNITQLATCFQRIYSHVAYAECVSNDPILSRELVHFLPCEIMVIVDDYLGLAVDHTPSLYKNQ